MPSIFHLSRTDAKSRYMEHNNEVGDIGYRRFLSRLSGEILPHLIVPGNGLDYGAGPGPALAEIFRENGHKIDLYDPYFHPDRSVLARFYDFVVCSETAEHFVNPKTDFDQIYNLLVPGGMLGIMTSVYYDSIHFPDWYYINDPTHVSFYSPETMGWIATHWNWEFWTPTENVYLFRKPDL